MIHVKIVQEIVHDILCKSEFSLIRDIIILHLISIQDGISITDKFILHAIPTTKINIVGQFYKEVSAIFHHTSKKVIIQYM